MKTRRLTRSEPPSKVARTTAEAETQVGGPSLVPFLPTAPYPHCLPEMLRMLEEIEYNEKFVVTQHVRQQIYQEVQGDFQQLLQEKDHHILDLQQQLRRTRQDMVTLQHLLCSHNKILAYSQDQDLPHSMSATDSPLTVATTPQGRLSLR